MILSSRETPLGFPLAENTLLQGNEAGYDHGDAEAQNLPITMQAVCEGCAWENHASDAKKTQEEAGRCKVQIIIMIKILILSIHL